MSPQTCNDLRAAGVDLLKGIDSGTCRECQGRFPLTQYGNIPGHHYPRNLPGRLCPGSYRPPLHAWMATDLGGSP